MSLAETLSWSLGLVIAIMLVMWLISLYLKNASIVDPFWGTGFVVIAWFTASWNLPFSARTWLLVSLVTIWGLRLSLFLLWRNCGHGEDSRYTAMRSHHGAPFWWISLFTVFLLQGLIMWFVSLPIQAVAVTKSAEANLNILDFVGCVVWAVGIIFESVGDWQLANFKTNPDNRGKVLDSGLWRYTRHPNYFGDFCVWWGIFIIGVAGGAWWTMASPVLMSLLLLKVSGVSLLEKTIVKRRPGYEDYIRRTNAFFPWLPKS